MQKHWAEAVYLVEEVVLMKRKNQIHKKRFDAVDVVVFILLTLWMLLVIVPFVNRHTKGIRRQSFDALSFAAYAAKLQIASQ